MALGEIIQSAQDLWADATVSFGAWDILRNDIDVSGGDGLRAAVDGDAYRLRGSSYAQIGDWDG